MNDLDLLLFLGLLINRTKDAQQIRKALKRLVKTVRGSRRPAINLMIKANNPYRVIEKLLDDWDDIPDEPVDPRADRPPTVGRDPKTGRYYSLARKP